MGLLLIATKNLAACETIRSCFEAAQKIEIVSNLQSCLDLFSQRRYEFLFIDVELLGAPASVKAYDLALEPFWKAFPTAHIVVMSTQPMLREAVMAVKAGASDYLTYPIDANEVKFVAESIQESWRMESELNYLRNIVLKSDSLDVIQTRSPLMRDVFDKIGSVAQTKSTVLLLGETGTGKDVLARLIHRNSHRSDRQFIPVHCGAIPDTLLESELFGHEKGAFTGAHRRKLGKFEIAQEGTIFLDEIGTITPSAQIMLLRVLQDRMFHRVGGEHPIEVDVRVLAATNVDLGHLIRQGSFRRDLYYRLSVFPVEIPPLRERTEDIPLLVEHFLKKLNRSFPKKIREVHPKIIEAFQAYPWPGNIRELENILERAFILETSSVITPESLPKELLSTTAPSGRVHVDPSMTLAEARRRGVDGIERQYLRDVLTVNKGRINDSAEAAGITPRQLHKLLTKYAIRKEEFKAHSHRSRR